MKWIPFPNEKLQVCGLPWFRENAPALWRLPKRVEDQMPQGVRRLMRYPGGGRIRFASTTSQLKIRLEIDSPPAHRNMSAFGSGGFDAYVDGRYWNSVCAGNSGRQEGTFFQGADRALKEITIYLPLLLEVRVLAIGLDADAEVNPPAPFAKELPIVLYGSSIAQGACACRPGMTYEAILARRLKLDFVNLGFGGSGRAEPEVVDLVAQVNACCYVFDLGKSYRMQPEEVYAAMLTRIRTTHADAPMVCITPIFSTREFYDSTYKELSQYVRDVMRSAAEKRMAAGDKNLYLIKGLELLGPGDADTFQEGVHPTDLGFQRIADRLQPMLQEILGLK